MGSQRGRQGMTSPGCAQVAHRSRRAASLHRADCTPQLPLQSASLRGRCSSSFGGFGWPAPKAATAARATLHAPAPLLARQRVAHMVAAATITDRQHRWSGAAQKAACSGRPRRLRRTTAGECSRGAHAQLPSSEGERGVAGNKRTGELGSGGERGGGGGDAPGGWQAARSSGRRRPVGAVFLGAEGAACARARARARGTGAHAKLHKEGAAVVGGWRK